jgi:hypothetical protein
MKNEWLLSVCQTIRSLLYSPNLDNLYVRYAAYLDYRVRIDQSFLYSRINHSSSYQVSYVGLFKHLHCFVNGAEIAAIELGSYFQSLLSFAKGLPESTLIAGGNHHTVLLFEDSKVHLLQCLSLHHLVRIEDLAPQASQSRNRNRSSFTIFVSGLPHIGQITYRLIYMSRRRLIDSFPNLPLNIARESSTATAVASSLVMNFST